MIEELASNDDLNRRLSLRRDLDRRGGIRKRVLCKRCNHKIPETRRRDALYCSTRCQRDHRREEITSLRDEMRLEVRRLTAPTACACGEPLDNIREGKKRTHIKRKCRKCQNRDNKRKQRALLRGMAADDRERSITENGGTGSAQAWQVEAGGNTDPRNSPVRQGVLQLHAG